MVYLNNHIAMFYVLSRRTYGILMSYVKMQGRSGKVRQGEKAVPIISYPAHGLQECALLWYIPT